MVLPISGNKRRFARAPLESKAELADLASRNAPTSTAPTPVSGSITEIGEGGFCLIAPTELTGPVRVSFEVPGFGKQSAVGEVRWRAKPGQIRRSKQGWAFGMRFSQIDQFGQASIGRYVAKLKQTYSQIQLALAMGKPHAQFAPLLADVGLSHLTDREQIKHRVSDVIGLLQPDARR